MNLSSLRIREKGFSSVELLLTVAIGGILLGLSATPLLESIQKYRLASEAQEIVSVMQRARMLALSQGSAFQVNIDTQAQALRIVDLSDPANPSLAARRLPEGYAFSVQPSNPIRFLPRGYVRGGTIELSDSKGRAITISVPASGEAQIGAVRNNAATQ